MTHATIKGHTLKSDLFLRLKLAIRRWQLDIWKNLNFPTPIKKNPYAEFEVIWKK